MSRHNLLSRWSTCFILLGIILTGCSEINIINTSTVNMRVLILVPDQAKGITRWLPPEDAIATFSSNGGYYSVTVLHDEDVRKFMRGYRDNIQSALFSPSGSLSPGMVAEMVKKLAEIESALEVYALQGGYCSGYVADFESVNVTIGWDENLDVFTMNCG